MHCAWSQERMHQVRLIDVRRCVKMHVQVLAHLVREIMVGC